VTVLCGRGPPAHARDSSPWPLPDGVRLVPDYDSPWITGLLNGFNEAVHRWSAAQAAPSSRSPTLRRSAGARWLDKADRFVWDAVPLEIVAIHVPHAVRAGRRLIERERPAVLWTTSYPFSAHLAGLALHRATGVPLVVDLRDPWTLNFLFDRKPAPARWLERRLEVEVFRTAARVVVTTETLAAEYAAMYPGLARKFITVRNSFDPLELPTRELPPRPVRLVHFGHVYGGARTLSGVYEALARLRSEGAFAAGEVVLDAYGRLPEEERSLAEGYGVADIIRVHDPVPYVEGLRRLRNAHLLLLPAWGTYRGRLFLPGKLYDYLLAGAPILAMGDNEELSDILARTRTGTLAAERDVDGIARTLRSAIDGTLAFAPDPAAVEEFSAPRAAARLAGVFDEVRRESGR
jgi:glycosyltransferase involved in cell wall biosynthesis